MKSSFRAVLLITCSFLALPLSALAQDKTVDFGDAITLEQPYTYSKADAESYCAEARAAVEEHITHLTSTIPSLSPGDDLSVSTKVDLRITGRESRGGSERRYVCSVTINSKNPKFLLREALFRQKQESPCNNTFEDLFAARKLLFANSSERRTLFRKRFVCSVHYVELLQR